MNSRPVGKLAALIAAALVLTGCSAAEAIQIVNIEGATDSPDFSVTSARIERIWGRTHLILEMAFANPFASIALSNWIDLGNSYTLWCEGEPDRSPPSPTSMATWTYKCEGDTDWPSNTSPADIKIAIRTVSPTPAPF